MFEGFSNGLIRFGTISDMKLSRTKHAVFVARLDLFGKDSLWIGNNGGEEFGKKKGQNLTRKTQMSLAYLATTTHARDIYNSYLLLLTIFEKKLELLFTAKHFQMVDG